MYTQTDTAGPRGPRRISLPTYPFARERYWINTRAEQPAVAERAAVIDFETAAIEHLFAEVAEQRLSVDSAAEAFAARYSEASRRAP